METKSDFEIDPAEDTRDLAFRPADPAAAQTLSPDQVEQYNRDGYLGGLPAFAEPEVTRIRSYFDELIDAVVSADDRRNSYSINLYHMVCEGLYDLVLTPRLLDYVADIIGPDVVCWSTHLFCKLPGDPMAIPLHQDATYWPFTPTKSVTVWLAIDDVDEGNAAMQFVPGSHLLGPLPHDELALDGTRVLKRRVADADAFTDRVTNSLRAGEVSLHTDLLLHGSPANASTRRRAGLTIRYIGGDVRTLPGWELWYLPAVHCRGEVGAHWPSRRRPTGEHPERMAEFSGDFDGNPPGAN